MDWLCPRSVQVVLLAAICSVLSAGTVRVKRDLLELEELLHAMTGRSGLAFNDYGCYCGWGGSGQPVDDIDACCKTHDACYGAVADCWPKWKEYKYQVKNISTTLKEVDCQDSADSCKLRVCSCDKHLVECVQNKHYNHKFKATPASRCKDRKPHVPHL